MGSIQPAVVVISAAAVGVLLKEIGLKYFHGNFLGFIGLCSILLLGCGAAHYGRYRYRRARYRHQPFDG